MKASMKLLDLVLQSNAHPTAQYLVALLPPETDYVVKEQHGFEESGSASNSLTFAEEAIFQQAMAGSDQESSHTADDERSRLQEHLASVHQSREDATISPAASKKLQNYYRHLRQGCWLWEATFAENGTQERLDCYANTQMLSTLAKLAKASARL
eukprot:scaffold614_cov44-Prasinocladus_malaysianus.AAC.1